MYKKDNFVFSSIFYWIKFIIPNPKSLLILITIPITMIAIQMFNSEHCCLI